MTWITHKGSPPRLPVVAFAGRIRIRGLAHSGAGPACRFRSPWLMFASWP